MRKLTILFITATICSILNCITFLVEGNIPAFAGWFVSSCALVLLHMLFGGWQKLKTGYEAEIAKYKRELDESREQEKIACKAVAEKREWIAQPTKWNNPFAKDMPKDNVLVKYIAVGYPNNPYYTRGWREPFGRWNCENKLATDQPRFEIIGWRPIHE